MALGWTLLTNGLGSVVRNAKLGTSLSRHMPAKAKTGWLGSENQCCVRAPDRPPHSWKHVTGTKQREPTWRRLPIQKGLSKLRILVMGFSTRGGGGTPQMRGTMARTRLSCRTMTGAGFPDATYPPAHISAPTSAENTSPSTVAGTSRR